MFLGYSHIIGDPAKRNKIRTTIRRWAFGILIAFACIGLGNTIAFIIRLER